MNARTNFDWINNLRFLAVFLVILVHVSQEVRVSPFWEMDIAYGSLARTAVPLFIMISGALLLRKPIELFEFLNKKLLRIVVPFIFWSLIYSILKLLTKKADLLSYTPFDIVSWIVEKLITGSSYHLWYVYMIIGLYLFIPIISKWAQNAPEKEVLYFLFIWAITLITPLPIEVSYFSGFVGYLILGKYLCDKEFRFPPFYFLLLLFLSYGFTAVATYISSKEKGEFSLTYYQYLSLNVALSSAAIFMFVKNSSSFTNKVYLKIRDFINAYSYGIYLVHILALNLLYKAGINWSIGHPAIGIPILCFCCLCLSIFIVFIVNMIPIAGRYISGKS